MSVETYNPIVLQTFGGEVTLEDRTDLPAGVASLAQNIEFFPGAIRTRRGMDFYKQYIVSSPTMDFAFAYRPDGTEYSYNTTAETSNYFRIAACEPTTNGFITISAYGGNVPYRTFFKAYNRLTMAATSNGPNAEAFPMKAVFTGNLSGANYFPVATRMAPAPPQANGTYANSGIAGSVSAGDHYFLIIFENSAGFRTAPMAVPIKLTATGGKKVDVSSLPIGPLSNGTTQYDIVKRIIFATSANPTLGTNQYPLTGYYCVETTPSGMVVGDNTSATTNVDFTDAVLVNGTPLDQYMDNTPLPPCKGFTVYNQRTVAWGVRNALMPSGLSALQTTPAPAPGVFNVPLSMDCGAGASMYGWTVVSAGGSWVHPGPQDAPGAMWQMVGDGVTLTRGKIRSNGDLFYGLTKGREYRIRFRANNPFTYPLGTGTLDISVTGSSILVSLGSALLPVGGAPQYFDYKLVDTTDSLSIGAYLNIGLNNTAANGAVVRITDVMIYPSDTPFYGNTPWVSKAGQPEAFSNLTGFLGISDADVSQSVQCCFVLRSGLFMARETSVFGTQDNQGEPSTWTIGKASDTFGACGPKAVAILDDTGTPGTYGTSGTAGSAVMVCRNGISLFNGATADKISQEIEPTLAKVNWAYGHLIWATADPARKKVFIGLPINNSTTINLGLCVDYAEGWGDPIANPGSGRKWAEWTIGTQAGLGNFATVDPADSRIVFSSNQGGTDINLVKWPSSTPNYFDYKNATTNLNIPSKYVTSTLPPNTENPWGGYNFGGITTMVNGAGNLVLNAVLLDNSLVTLPQSGTPRVLAATPLHDLYIKAHIYTEHLSLQIQNGTNVGDYFAMDMLTILAKRSPFTPVRGI